MTVCSRRCLRLLLPFALFALLFLPSSPLPQHHAQASTARANLAPSPSGALPAYPLNHVLATHHDAAGTPAPNADF